MSFAKAADIAHRQSGTYESVTGSTLGAESMKYSELGVDFGLSEVKTPESGNVDATFKGGYGLDEINIYSYKHIGLLFNYLSVGIIYAASTSILYPVMVVKFYNAGAKYNAAYQLVTLFWAYKIFFGILSDCFPIMGLRRKPYMFIGWLICAIALILITQLDGDDFSTNTLVIYLMIANFGYVLADVCADGYLVWVAKHEAIEVRGRTQTMCYLFREIGRAIANLLVGFALSGPQIMCTNYFQNKNTPCPYPSAAIANYTFFDPNTVDDSNWCHQPCDSATFAFGLSLPQCAWILAGCNVAFLPFYMLLSEHKAMRESVVEKLQIFWVIFQRRGVWQITLWTMNNALLSGVANNAQTITLNSWLNLSPIQNSVLSVMENLVFIVGLILVRTYFINFSWRKMMIIGTVIPVPLGLLYLLIVYDVWRSSYFYMFTALTGNFLSTLTFLVGVFCIVEVSEPGYEAITYSLVTSANNAVIPLSSVLSNQISALFALQNSDISRDDAAVHNQFTICWVVCTAINLSSMLTLPLLPEQKEHARELLEKGGSSKKWGAAVLCFGLMALIYSSAVNFATLDPTLACHYWLGGNGCTADESRALSIILIIITFLWVILTTYFVGYRKESFLPLPKL